MMNLRKLMVFLTACAAGPLLALPAAAGDVKSKNPYAMSNNSWISLSGEVESVKPDSFLLDYGKGRIKVEMDDNDRDAEGYKLVKGDKVTVYGYVDADMFQTRTIEASSVYVDKLGTWFYASGRDEEGSHFETFYAPPLSPGRVTVYGKVTSVGDEEFTIDTGLRRLTVDVEQMAYDPLDDVGYQKVKRGDWVSVTGRMDSDLFEGRELEADSVVSIS
jgi:uncharacterized protein YdeI (BOF family)